DAVRLSLLCRSKINDRSAQRTVGWFWPFCDLCQTPRMSAHRGCDRTCATGAPHFLPFAPLIRVPNRGSVVGIEWGNRGGAAGDIEDLASRLFCRCADRDFACRDPSARGIAPERRHAECKSC